MKERLEAIIKHEKITPSRLADLIGVQRSGVSHIMSGRNKPGLDFLNKLLNQFPHISGDWLITGQGEMLKNKATKPVVEQLSIESPSLPKKSFKTPLNTAKEESQVTYETKPVVDTTKSEKVVERMVVFYTDKTFAEYKPE
ncbi:helix-turn-helix domain-containing protein [Carboxylicivirga sp. N1Y90]|uniref:helix-turn-helix domain-containing protein n=1 Tax=Carboxylicivirga fragile TaxID=3417571 RepID=UPI003D356D87|nr:helix-turn-helix transcriptional regulator [Marinilabiliaceae bacterium N1Y90]